jgi:hypothetical protein
MRRVLVSLSILALVAASCDNLKGDGTESSQSSEGGKVTTVKTPGGDVTIAEGKAALPTMPDYGSVYPGAKVLTSFSARGAMGAGDTVSMSTPDDAEKILSYYKKQFEAAGLKILMESRTGELLILAAQDEKQNRGVQVTITPTSEAGHTIQLVVGSSYP